MASGAGAALVVGIVGVGALVAFHAAGQKPATPPTTTTPPATPPATPPPAPAQSGSVLPEPILKRITDAIATLDPAKMRAEADRLEAEGWIAQAMDLRRAADVAALSQAVGLTKTILAGDFDLSKIKVRLPGKRSSSSRSAEPTEAPTAGSLYGVPDEPIAASPLPGMEAAVSPPTANAQRIEAQRLVNFLEATPPTPGESSALVKSFQAHNDLKASGYYGAAVALTLANRYGLCPPRPINWPAKGRAKAKRNYREAMLEIAARDPQRAEEFQRAAKV